MAPRGDRPVPGSGRESPLLRQVVLLVAFVVLVIAGVFTVLLPELEDDPVESPRGTDTAEPAE